jgi:hypothetical protein
MESVQIKEDNMTVFVDYMDKLLPRATGNTVHWGKVSDASRPLVPAVFQVTCHVCSSSTEGILLTILEGYGTVWAKQWLSSRNMARKPSFHAPMRNKVRRIVR